MSASFDARRPRDLLLSSRTVALTSQLSLRRRRALLAALVAIAALIAGATAHTLLGVGGHSLDRPVRDWVSSAVYLLVSAVVVLRAVSIKQARWAWIVLAAGITLYGAGNLVWALWLEGVASPPIPSICDLLWLTLYPASYLGLMLLARRHWRSVPAGVWLDGIVAGLGIASIGAAVVFRPVLQSATGRFVAVATNLAYPIGDLLLAALVIGVLSLRSWRLDRAWAFLGAGFLVLAVADSVYLLRVADGLATSSSVANLFYLSGVTLLALAAWQPPPRSELPRTESFSSLAVPGFFAFAAVGVIAFDHFDSLGELPFALALLTVFAALLRTALAFHDLRTLSEARRQSVTDDLSGLPNRRLFERRLDEAIAHAGAEGRVAVLILDLDRFKELNDSLGHHSGDELLRQIGPRLSGVLRPVDTLARLGGDEFGVVIDSDADEADALGVAARIHDALGEPFKIQDLALRADASIGIALFPGHGTTAGVLLQHADVAMYRAKNAQTGTELYASAFDTNSRDRLALAGDLAHAIERGQIKVYFQPQADAVGRGIVGVESLVRWDHPVHGLLLPADFIPLAETTGLIRSLTRYVIDRAVAQCAEWRNDGFDLKVSVNVAVADLLDVDLPAQVKAAIARHRLPPAALVVEVTESSVHSDPARIHALLARLSTFGVGISLDDFGTGYSSLDHLKILPVSELKIDRSFIAHLTTSPADAAIVLSTIQLAHRLGKRVVAEGVEDEETWQRLAAAGCHLIQGYTLSPPLPPEQLAHLFREIGCRQATPIEAAAPAAFRTVSGGVPALLSGAVRALPAVP